MGVRPPMAEPLALYVHWPFCVSKCPYCDFNSHVRESVDQEVWRAALLADLRHEAELLPGRPVSSIFFGGGTPSLMPPETVAAVIGAADDAWGLAGDCEITLEANPNSVEVANFAALASAGVNRVSIGVQSFEPQILEFLGRAHSGDEARRAIAAAQEHFARVSFDLIYARPGQTLAQWETELNDALAFGTGHLSLYQLTIEPGTRFATLAAKGDLVIPDGDTAADLFDATQAMTSAAGLPRYEVSNHARPGEESRHNLTYWRYGDYAGVGPGAHGRRLGQATERHKKPENFIAAVERNGHGLKVETDLPAHERATEAMLMGLRLTEGIDLARIEARSGLRRDAFVDEGAVARLAGQGLLVQKGDRLAVTDDGILLLDSILSEVVRTG
ncbi:coproporphyrinogen III oxidase [Sphingopyxis sp. H071]|nr:coproporphyrinogen III oxidase [Sphingopyxis sp. H057]KTE52861.1 coproporphyrinogen III oxidase [Sphingopyxis sp. H073]KTE55049.1 coproporphyrinogen III oxidase [Sphingopyxis sp. H071]KTE62511.1 coproporphyrinogen III oxidase [Sphingopyxis sp. H107]KTE66056.1 coproporphyrinogen III oxidase [Sphingopyxis sp. H100]KTE73608.1 coproporphyrinogen III oxidase [Sphingopyxis sp. H081]KTE80944.1 coproporphyrinogen III oxidase [Sphingopyxis sp. H067]